MWKCRCDCGNECVVYGYLLQSGRRKSCGCIRSTAEQMRGKRFGKLTVTGEDPDNKTTLQKVICRCDCGREKSVATRDLKNGKVTSCGCDKMRGRRGSDFRERQYNAGMEEKRSAFQKGDFSGIHDLNDWVYIWLRDILPNVVKATTIQMYGETMEHHILPVLGKEYLEEITEKKVNEWVRLLQNTEIPGTQNGKMTEGTVRNTLSVLSGCLRDAQKYGLTDRNPCQEAAWTLKSKNVGEEKIWLDETQVARLDSVLAGYCDEEGYPLGIGFRLVLYGGISLSEAAALRWMDVDFDRKCLHIRNFISVKRDASKDGVSREYEIEKLTGRKHRDVPVPDFLLRQLEEIRGSYKPEEEMFVLCQSKTSPIRIDRMRAALMRKARSCGMGTVTPRMLRDTYAMRAVQAGAPSDMIAELMGYASSQQVIRRYMPLSALGKQDLVNQMFAASN